jgi:hypothetical protein
LLIFHAYASSGNQYQSQLSMLRKYFNLIYNETALR